jgi:putative DNA primase/helicase
MNPDTFDDINGQPEPDAPEVWPPPTNPMAVARQAIEDRSLTSADGVLLVRWWRGAFYLWCGTHWEDVSDSAIKAMLYSALEHAWYWKAPTKDGGKPKLVEWEPSRRKVGDLAEALQSIVIIGERTDPPAWLDGTNRRHLVAMRNGLLDLEGRELQAHSPIYFNLFSLPYAYDPDAPEPQGWLRFLKELWPDDPESIRLLQQYFGYIVSGDTRMHKLLFLVGPPRSGKGTIARVLAALIGRHNTAGPTLASLVTHFGLQPLLGKPLAVISDARIRNDVASAVVERLLTITGEDTITVDLKYRDPWTGKLPSRFLIISNELPNLGDAAGAIATRFLILALQESWLGREDYDLTDKLLGELPSILRWSLDGLDDLRGLGHFIEPASSRDAVIELADLASPVSPFLREACERGPGREVSCRRLYQAWRRWSIDHGRDHPTTEAVFGRDLRAAAPGIKRVQHRDGERRWWVYTGLDLTGSYTQYIGESLVPPGAEPSPEDGLSPAGTSDFALYSVWRCYSCGNSTYTDMTGMRCNCGGTFQESES